MRHWPAWNLWGANRRLVPLTIACGALVLLALACGPAEEPTATSAPEPTATTEPTATPAVEEPAAEGPTATPAAAEPTATSADAGEEPEQYAAGALPEITPELLERIPDMSLEEVTKTFPAAYPANWDADDIKRGGTYRGAITWDISIWDTRKAAAGGTTSTANVVYERLVQYQQGPGRDPNSPAIVPDLAKSWAYNDDATQLTFQLREGMCWGDIDAPFECGPEIVAEDFVYILTQYRDNSVQAGAYQTLESVETPDKYTVVMNFTKPSYFVLPFLAGKDASMFNPYLAKAGRMKNELVGPGPFVLVEQQKSQSVRLKRNPNHFMKDQWGNQLPYLDEVVFLVTPEISTRKALLRTGKVEYAASTVNVLRDAVNLLKTNPKLRFAAVKANARGFVMSPQLNNPMFQDANARRALSLALDEKRISNVVYAGRGVPSDAKFAWWHYRDTLPTWDEDLDAAWGPYINHFDLEKAKELWAKTGLGETTIRLPYYAYNPTIADYLALAVSDWRELGITLKPQSQDYSDYNSSLQNATQEQMIMSWQQQAYDAIGIALTRLRSDGGGNRENVNDPKMDELVDELVLTGDPAEQRELVNQMRDIYLDKAYFWSIPDYAFSFQHERQPWVMGARAGEYAYLSYYYQGPVLRHVWLNK